MGQQQRLGCPSPACRLSCAPPPVLPPPLAPLPPHLSHEGLEQALVPKPSQHLGRHHLHPVVERLVHLQPGCRGSRARERHARRHSVLTGQQPVLARSFVRQLATCQGRGPNGCGRNWGLQDRAAACATGPAGPPVQQLKPFLLACLKGPYRTPTHPHPHTHTHTHNPPVRTRRRPAPRACRRGGAGSGSCRHL